MAFDGLLGGKVGSWLLGRFVSPPGVRDLASIHTHAGPCHVDACSRLEALFGRQFGTVIEGKAVLDYGCGYGETVVALATLGAAPAIGMDIRDSVLEAGRALALERRLQERCQFLNVGDVDALQLWDGRVDMITSIDGFEHYGDPASALRQMWTLLRPGGRAFVSFGPPWWHPYGSHLTFMGVPPWCHVIFSEQTIMALRSRYRSDGARRFEEVDGGLNRMTIRRFERLVAESGFKVEDVHFVPIRGTRLLSSNRWGREVLTSMVKALLIKPSGCQAFSDPST